MEKELLILVLNDGTQLLANTAEHNGVYMCENVLQIIVHAAENGGINTGFMPYLPYSDVKGGLAIPTNMAIIAVPNQQFKEFYAKQFGLIITPPEPQIVLS